jgi:hypothetical protein
VPELEETRIEEFSAAQKHIRVETTRQLKEANVDYILKYKRVKNLEEFRTYIYSFLELLEKGKCYPRKGRK